VELRQAGYLPNREAAEIDNGGRRLDAVVHIEARGALLHKQARLLLRSPLVASVVMFAAVMALRFSAHTPQRTGILLLLVGPIVVMSLAYRPRVGAAAATAGVVACVLSQQFDANAIDAIGVGTRAFTFYAIPLTIWLARTDGGREPAPVDCAPDGGDGHLTRREREVLGLVAVGHTNAEIAEMLVLSVRTVESHRASLRRKLGRPSRPELLRHAERSGLVPADAGAGRTDVVAATDRAAHGLVY